MEESEENVYQKIAELVSASCIIEKRPSNEFQKFHKVFLNFYFNSMEVNIDYETKLIAIWNSKPLNKNPVRLYDVNKAITERVCYTNLEETLSGCINEGHLQNNFYKKLLYEFGDYKDDNEDILSA